MALTAWMRRMVCALAIRSKNVRFSRIWVKISSSLSIECLSRIYVLFLPVVKLLSTHELLRHKSILGHVY